MKLIKTTIALSAIMFMVACGNNSNKNTTNAENSKSETVTPDSMKLKAGKYINETMGYSISYPEEILSLESETTEEQTFVPKEGNAKLRIYVDERKDKSGKVLTFNEAFDIDKESNKEYQVAYSSLNPLFYTVSGVKEKEIFYQKTIVTKGTLVTAKLTYTKEEKPTYDAMIAPLFNSFK